MGGLIVIAGDKGFEVHSKSGSGANGERDLQVQQKDSSVAEQG